MHGFDPFLAWRSRQPSETLFAMTNRHGTFFATLPFAVDLLSTKNNSKLASRTRDWLMGAGSKPPRVLCQGVYCSFGWERKDRTMCISFVAGTNVTRARYYETQLTPQTDLSITTLKHVFFGWFSGYLTYISIFVPFASGSLCTAVVATIYYHMQRSDR